MAQHNLKSEETPAPVQMIYRTFEDDAVFINKAIERAIEKVFEKIPTREPYYKLKNPNIKAVFPDLSQTTLKKWAMQGRLGKLGEDKKFYVRISEIERVLFENN
jgi:hypothetical protein